MQQGPATAPKNEPWTYEENEILLVRMRDSHCLDSRGRPKWAQVAKGLPGRTPQEARCRWRRMNDAKKRRKGGETFRNKCSTCGLSRRGHICPGVNSAAVAAYKLAALREPKLPKPAAPPPPPPPAPPPRAWPLPPGEPTRALGARPRSSPFGEEDNAQEEGEETDGEESFHALLALFQVGRHVEPASPHHMHASIATTAALGFAEPSPEASAEQANHSVDIAAAAATIDAAATPGVTQVVELVDEPNMLPGWSAWWRPKSRGLFTCKHPGCGKAYNSSDGVRKHCRVVHRDWLSSLSGYGPESYCSWEDCL